MKDLKIAAISALSAICVSAIGFYGGWWTYSSTAIQQVAVNREIDIKMIDVALAILAGEKGVENGNQSIEARRFAVRVLRQYSQIRPDMEGEKAIAWDKWAEDSKSQLQIDRGLVLGGPNTNNLKKERLEELAYLNEALNWEISTGTLKEDGTRSRPGCGPRCSTLKKRIAELEAKISSD